MNKFNKLAIGVVVAVTALTGCQRYLDRSEGVLPSSGNAHAVNNAKMVVDPWNRDAYNNRINPDGERLGDAVTRYKTANKKEKSAGAPPSLNPAAAQNQPSAPPVQ